MNNLVKMKRIYGHICGTARLLCLLLPALMGTGTGASAQERLLNAADMEYAAAYGGHDYGLASVGAKFQTGNFHKAQDAADKTGIFFDAEGERQVGIFRLKGDFRFTQSFENGVKYASTFDPLRAMPYVIADSTGGNWQKQHYDMWADMSVPIVRGRLYGGLGVDIEVGRGAKKVDPRPQAGMCRIELKPSLSVSFAPGFSMSAGFIYSLYRESSNLILYDSSVPQKLYLLKGLGQYTYEIFGSTERERKYEGNTLGGTMDLRYTDDMGTLSIYGEYRNGLEKVMDIDYNKPHHRGNYYTHDFRTGCAISVPMYGHYRNGLGVKIEYSGLRHSGREFVQHFDSSSDVNGWVTDSDLPGRYTNREDHLFGSATWYLNDKDRFRRSWAFTIEAEINNCVQEYRAAAAKETIKNYRYALAIQKYVFTRSGVFDISLKAKISEGNGSKLEYTPRETEDTNIAAGLIDHDFALPSNWYSGDLDLGYTWMLKRGNALRLQAQAFFKDSGRNRLTAGENGLDADSAPGRWWRAGCALGVAFKF